MHALKSSATPPRRNTHCSMEYSARRGITSGPSDGRAIGVPLGGLWLWFGSRLFRRRSTPLVWLAPTGGCWVRQAQLLTRTTPAGLERPDWQISVRSLSADLGPGSSSE